MQTINFRPFNLETDAPALARLYSTASPQPVSTETIRDWWAPRRDEIRTTTLAIDGHGQAAGYWDVERETWMRPGVWWLKVMVDPPHRRRGIGSVLFAAALQEARRRGAAQLTSEVRDDDPDSLSFARKRGFEIEHHSFESVLDLASFDEHCFSGLLERVRGFRFFSLAEAGLTEENKRRLYELNRESGLDNPGNNRTFPDYESFCMNVYNASWFRADTQLLAAEGDTWAGLSAISLDEDTGSAYNAFTGVLRQFRGRGLAQALKLQTILLAKRAGMRVIRTNNDSQNAPMLAVNRKLGYQPVPGIYRLLCSLDPAG